MGIIKGALKEEGKEPPREKKTQLLSLIERKKREEKVFLTGG